MSILLEDMIPGVLYNGITSNKNVDFSGATSVALPAGTTIAGTTASGTSTITSTSANALTVGANGATNPVLKVNANTASVATGLTIVGAATGNGVALTAIDSGADTALTLNAKGTGTIGIGSVSTGAVTITPATTVTGNLTVGSSAVVITAATGATAITTASANGLVVGRLGATTPALQVDASTATSITGLKIKSAAAGNGLALSAVGEASNGNLTIDAQGSGTISLNVTGTGNIVMGRATTGVSSTVTGALTAKSGTAVPATAGAVAAGAPLVANSNGMTIEWTTDAPTHIRPKGSVVLNINGSSGSTRMYINTDGAGTWTAVTTAG